ncbi:alpha/beta hydrolase [Chthoniobacter flavus]|uniref:alpha/beta hydrolase n=1 Tax=Chthoniobacter flavus TaxID=191863 RepID=UPI00030ADAF1|nr:alpha/beta hydrolase [Chthoniobacter flavus]
MVGAYAVAAILLVLGENRLAFPGWTIRQPWLGPPAKTMVEEESMVTPDGNTIQGWWLPATDWTPGKGAVLYMHGNGQNLSTCGKALRSWRNELHMSVLGFDYPGFGHSSGTPDEQSCYAASQAAFDWIVREKGVAARDVVVIGQSMGGAMATEVASRQRCRALITSGAFTSFPDIAQYHYGWLPARYLVRLKFDNLAKMRRMETPVFIAQGMEDQTVPFSQGAQLYAAAVVGLKRFYPMPGHGHSQPDSVEFYEAVRAFLQKTRRENLH